MYTITSNISATNCDACYHVVVTQHVSATMFVICIKPIYVTPDIIINYIMFVYSSYTIDELETFVAEFDFATSEATGRTTPMLVVDDLPF
jgi:hypothetical protein